MQQKCLSRLKCGDFSKFDDELGISIRTGVIGVRVFNVVPKKKKGCSWDWSLLEALAKSDRVLKIMRAI